MPSCDIYEFSLQTFGPGPSSVEFKYVRIVAMFVYAMKENIIIIIIIIIIMIIIIIIIIVMIKTLQCALKTKQVGNVFPSLAARKVRPFVKYSNRGR